MTDITSPDVPSDVPSAPMATGKPLSTVIGILLLAVMALGLAVALITFFSAPYTATIGEAWFLWDHGSLNLTQAVVQRYVSPSLWDQLVVPFLLWPILPASISLSVVAGSLSAVLLIRRRR